jgi:hypothetical protein
MHSVFPRRNDQRGVVVDKIPVNLCVSRSPIELVSVLPPFFFCFVHATRGGGTPEIPCDVIEYYCENGER